jgi:hypothetical protein
MVVEEMGYAEDVCLREGVPVENDYGALTAASGLRDVPCAQLQAISRLEGHAGESPIKIGRRAAGSEAHWSDRVKEAKRRQQDEPNEDGREDCGDAS